MPLAAILALATAFCQLLNTLAGKLLSEKRTPTFRRWAKKVGNPTAEMIAEWGRKHQESR